MGLVPENYLSLVEPDEAESRYEAEWGGAQTPVDEPGSYVRDEEEADDEGENDGQRREVVRHEEKDHIEAAKVDSTPE
jgi:hypothetical protein